MKILVPNLVLTKLSAPRCPCSDGKVVTPSSQHQEMMRVRDSTPGVPGSNVRPGIPGKMLWKAPQCSCVRNLTPRQQCWETGPVGRCQGGRAPWIACFLLHTLLHFPLHRGVGQQKGFGPAVGSLALDFAASRTARKESVFHVNTLSVVWC